MYVAGNVRKEIQVAMVSVDSSVNNKIKHI